MTNPLVNILVFQLCWAANVLGAASGMPWIGPCALAVWIALHLAGLGAGRGAEAALLGIAAVLGYAADSALVLAGLMEFPEAARLGSPSPLWMVALWIGFAATLRHSLKWLGGRYALGAALGALLGPLAYLAGQKLGAVAIAPGAGAVVAVGLEWALAMPALMALARHGARGRRCAGAHPREVTP